MALIDKETIRAEIERRTYNAHEMPDSRPDKQFYEGKDVAYGEILAFLDTLPEQEDILVINKKEWEAQEKFRKNKKFGQPLPEQPVEGLEEEIKRYFQGLWPGMETAEQCNTDMHFTPPAIMRLARHFAEWGRKQALQEIYDGKVKPVDKIIDAWLDDEQNT